MTEAWFTAYAGHIWLGGAIIGGLITLLVAGWKDYSEPELGLIVLAVLSWPLIIPVGIAAAILAGIVIGLWRLGKYARKRHEFLPNVLKRMAGPSQERDPWT